MRDRARSTIAASTHAGIGRSTDPGWTIGRSTMCIRVSPRGRASKRSCALIGLPCILISVSALGSTVYRCGSERARVEVRRLPLLMGRSQVRVLPGVTAPVAQPAEHLNTGEHPTSVSSPNHTDPFVSPAGSTTRILPVKGRRAGRSRSVIPEPAVAGFNSPLRGLAA